jgi:hypothetical protein
MCGGESFHPGDVADGVLGGMEASFPRLDGVEIDLLRCHHPLDRLIRERGLPGLLGVQASHGLMGRRDLQMRFGDLSLGSLEGETGLFDRAQRRW